MKYEEYEENWENDEKGRERILQKLAQKNGLQYRHLPYQSTTILMKENIHKIILNFVFPINSYSSAEIGQDRISTALLLEHSNIPCFPSEVITHPRHIIYTKGSVFTKLIQYFNDNNEDIYIKAIKISESGEKQIYRIQSLPELEILSIKFLQSGRYGTFMLSPTLKIVNEFRNIVLNDQVQLVYKKESAYVIGDGKSTLKQLLVKDNVKILCEKICKDNKDKEIKSPIGFKVPKKGEKVILNYNNYSGTSKILFSIDYNDEENEKNIENDKEMKEKLNRVKEMAIETSKVLTGKFMTIDFVELEGGNFLVFQVDSRVYLDDFIRYNKQRGLDIAFNIFDRALSSIFA